MKVALITGASSGIGLALAGRLLHHYSNIHICLACRNKAKAESTREILLASYSTADISILQIDVGNIASVYSAAQEIRLRYQRLDFLYCNAGIMPDTTIDWMNFFSLLFSPKCIHMFATGQGILKQEDRTTSDGLREIFVTNVFGHFVLVRELETMLGGVDDATQIVWTSSVNAKKANFDLNDVQHRNSNEAYSSSKYAIDLVSYAINEKMNKKNIYSHTVCPGLVMTNLTYGILPWWIWLLLLPVLWLLRLFIPSMTVTPANGSEALIWLTRQAPESLNPMMKYYSRVTMCGRRYVESKKMDVDCDLARNTYDKLSDLEKECKRLMFKNSN